VAVVRYFGGILLGVPGLINAYRSAAADAIANAERVEKTATVWRQIEFTYENMPMVESFIKAQGLTAKNREFSEHCSIEVEIPLSLHDKIVKKLKKSVTFKENSDKSI
jgi:putative IMPACT (imprinted ancient) family translation regulator